jgi:integrase/recombinase XerD
MDAALSGKWPVLVRHERAAEWLGIWAGLGRAPRTIDAYARGLAEYLEACERDGADPLTASRAQVAGFVRELRTRPSKRGGNVNVVALDSGAGLSNATLQQRLVPVRLFYDFLVEEGVRGSNPVGRGAYAPGRQFGGGSGSRPLVPRNGQAAVDPGRIGVAAAAGGLPRRAGAEPRDARAGLRCGAAQGGAVLAAHR